MVKHEEHEGKKRLGRGFTRISTDRTGHLLIAFVHIIIYEKRSWCRKEVVIGNLAIMILMYTISRASLVVVAGSAERA